MKHHPNNDTSTTTDWCSNVSVQDTTPLTMNVYDVIDLLDQSKCEVRVDEKDMKKKTDLLLLVVCCLWMIVDQHISGFL